MRTLPAAVAAGLLVAGLAGGCSSVDESAERGRLLLEQYDCGSCHVIPGVRRARGVLGPTLERYAHRVYIAGELPNQPELLVRWIQHPPALVPDTLMPDQGVLDTHARDMGVYLMGLH